MNKELSPKQITLILIPFIFLAIVYFLATGKANDAAKPLNIKVNENNHLVLPLSNGQIFEFTAEGDLIRHINSQDLGIDQYHGDIQFINGNEILIYGGFKNRTILEDLTAFAQSSPDTADSDQQGLWHCNIRDKSCTQFNPNMAQPLRTYHLTYDPIYKHIYLANTSDHTLTRLNLNGSILSQVEGDTLRYPNQVRIFANQLWVTDTNHHKIKYYPLGQDSLHQASGEFDIQLAPECARSGRASLFDIFKDSPHCYPNALALVDKQIWVGVAENGMENNEIQQFTTSGEFVGRLDLSQLETTLDLAFSPDPNSFVQVGQYVIFSDINNRQIYKYDLSLQTWQQMLVPELNEVLQHSLDQRMYYLYINYLVSALFVIFIMIGVIVGIKPHIEFYKQKQLQDAQSPVTDNIPQPSDKTFWFTHNKKMKLLVWGYAAASVMSIICIVLLYFQLQSKIEAGSDNSEYLFICSGLLYIIIVGAFFIRKPFTSRLGISGRLVLVSHKSGETSISPLQHVYKVGQRGLLVEDSFFALGSPQLKFIDQKQYDNYLKPRLNMMNQMSEWGYFKYRMANMNKESGLTVLLLLPLFIFALLLP